MDGIAFLERPKAKGTEPIYVLCGDEDFLKRRVLAMLRAQLFGEDGDDFGVSTYAGDATPFAAVNDELQTLPFLAPRRMVVVQDAEPFVTQHRPALERYVAEPSRHGVLVLVVKSWPANTRLARALTDRQTIVCKAPQGQGLPAWCARWAESEYGCQLQPAAARMLVDLVGPELGLLDQELAKLAVYVGGGRQIAVEAVDRLVGSSRAESAFKILEAVGEGRPAKALDLLERLFDQGEDEMRVLGAFSYQLRRLAQAARLARQGTPLSRALDEVGIQYWARDKAEQQLRHLGPHRASLLFDWLVEVDLGMKGSSQLSWRLLLERLVVRLAQPASVQTGAR